MSVCARTCCLVYLLWHDLQVEPNATIGEIKSMFHKSRECQLSADYKECDFTSRNKDETFPFQILSGIRPDSPFASTPVSTLCECTWCVVLSVYNLWCFSEGKSLKDEDVLQYLPVGTTATFYFRDLGAQISWVTVSTNTHCAPKRVTVEHQQSLQSTYCTSHHQHGYIQCLPWLEKQCVCLHTHICYVWGIFI